MLTNPQRHRRPRYVSALRVAVYAASAGVTASAQVLRVGGFDFNAKAHLEGVYTTNVERERSSQTSESLEDYYLLTGIALNSVRETGLGSRVDLDTGVTVEKHFIRDDLDNSSSPFGRFNVRLEQDVGRLRLFGTARYEKLSDSNGDRFSPDGLGRARDPRTEIQYGGGASFEKGRLSAAGSYSFKQERHDEDQFLNRDLDETVYQVQSFYKVGERFQPGYRFDTTDSVYPNEPNSDRKEVNHRFLFPFRLLEKPGLEYTFIWQKEDQGDGRAVAWEPRHTVSLIDRRELSSTVTLDYSVLYDNEKSPESDEIQLTYRAGLTHKLSRTAEHTLAAERQPADTFGTTLKSDITRYRYSFRKTDLFVYNLNLDAYAELEEAVPVGDDELETQEIVRYAVTLKHLRPLSRKLVRGLEYTYYAEDNNTITELMDEHRFTVSYEYTF